MVRLDSPIALTSVVKTSRAPSSAMTPPRASAERLYVPALKFLITPFNSTAKPISTMINIITAVIAVIFVFIHSMPYPLSDATN
jgi:hypothetical protein